jgi:hypothetical protein
LTIPHHLTANIGRKKHFFEFGFGGTYISGVTTEPYFAYPTVGYRFLPLKSDKLNFRVFSQIPFTGIDTEDIIFMPLGVNIGISFN